MAGKRTYSSPLREADAAATRRRIIDAASRLFVRDGYGATTLKAIADEAGVSAQTVYLNGPKPALLKAAYEVALASSEGFRTLNEVDEMLSIAHEPDPAVLVDRYADYMTAALARIAELVSTLRAAADSDPSVREVYRDITARRDLSLHEGIELMVARGVIAREAAADAEVMLSMATTADNYLLLRGAGWSTERYRGWLRQQVEALRGGAQPGA